MIKTCSMADQINSLSQRMIAVTDILRDLTDLQAALSIACLEGVRTGMLTLGLVTMGHAVTLIKEQHNQKIVGGHNIPSGAQTHIIHLGLAPGGLHPVGPPVRLQHVCMKIPDGAEG